MTEEVAELMDISELKEMSREVFSSADALDIRRNSPLATKSVPFKPLARPAVKKNLPVGQAMTCKGQSIGRRNIGQYESSSPSSRGGGASRAKIERESVKVKKKKVEDFGDY